MEQKRKRGRPRKNVMVVPPTPTVNRYDDYLVADLRRDIEKRRPRDEDSDSWVNVIIGAALLVLSFDFIIRLVY